LLQLIQNCFSDGKVGKNLKPRILSHNYDTFNRISSSKGFNSSLVYDYSNLSKDEITISQSPFVYQLILRAIYLFIIFSPIIWTSGIAYVSPLFRRYIWFNLISMAITAGGAAFIKWGQWASTRTDMFPEEFCSLLSKLQSNAPRHSFDYTKKLIQDQLGRPLNEIFDSFSPLPVASGSVSI
jgi:aarF domain-containing kinase